MRDYRLLIFDWDGTLVDSIDRIVESIEVAALACDLPVCERQAIRGIIGLGLPEAFAVLYPSVDPATCYAGFRQAYAEHYLCLEQQPSAMFAGVREALDAFRQEGYALAVATGKSRLGLDRVLEGHGLSEFFDITRCADETASKPEPLMLEQILQHCAVSAEQALMVGDSVFDLQMARNAKVDAVAVGYGAQSLEQLQVCQPVLAITQFPELAAWLQSR